jgi:enoyl-CoA hydratase/carnithine racemase
MNRPFSSRPADSFEFREILYSKAEGIARIVINRPDRYNAYSTGCLEELATALRDASFDDAVGVIVLTGAGDRAFCTGGDVKEYAELYTRSPRDYWKYMGLFRAYIEGLLDAGKPTIARINGMAVGGGNESNLACDLAVMAEHAYLRQVGSSVGSVACGGATQWLPITIGDRRARQMLLLNEPIPARQALAWGLVNQVVPSVTRNGSFVEGASDEEIRLAQERKDGYAIDLSRLDEEVNALARKLLEKFPECTRYTKANLNFWKELAWHQTIGHGRDWLSVHYACFEPLEGMSAFVEKRRPDYVGLRERAAAGEEVEFPWGAYTASCPACGAKHLPSRFRRCGQCGAALPGREGGGP